MRSRPEFLLAIAAEIVNMAVVSSKHWQRPWHSRGCSPTERRILICWLPSGSLLILAYEKLSGQKWNNCLQSPHETTTPQHPRRGTCHRRLVRNALRRTHEL